jgi:2-phosphosulfolactate phosphatase
MGVDDQPGFDPRLAWAAQGGTRLALACPVLVVVDVLRFTTAVEVAVTSGARVVPERWPGAGSPAGAGEEPGRRVFSLSPASLAGVAAGTRVVLASTADLRLAAAYNVSRTVPRLEGGAFAQLS